MKKILASIILTVFLLAVSIPCVYAVQGFAGHPNVVNVTLTSASTEYSTTLPADVGAITIQSRTNADFQMSFVSGTSGTNYFTVKAGTSYYETTIGIQSKTIYFQSANAGQVVEIVYLN